MMRRDGRRWYADGHAEETRAERETNARRSYVCECTVPDPRPVVVMGCTFMDTLECGRCGHEIKIPDPDTIAP